MKLLEITEKYHKVSVFRNDKNRGMFHNKLASMLNAHIYGTSKWAILLDSDNVVKSDYIDKLYEIQEWEPELIYAPDFAAPEFNYKEFAGYFFNMLNLHHFLRYPMFKCALNTCNYFVNIDAYLDVHAGFKGEYVYGGADSIFFLYLWFKDGHSLQIVKDMEYFHRVHETSTFALDIQRNMDLSAEVAKMLSRESKSFIINRDYKN